MNASPPLPLVSVIIPVYNAEAFLPAALDSVLAQDYPHREILVVDDGSTDGSADVARDRGTVQLLQEANLGPAAARNLAIAAARGDLLAFLDADDRWLPRKLSTQVRHLQAHPEHGYAICRMRTFCEPGCTLDAAFNARHYAGEPVATIPSALVVRCEIFAKVGLFDPRLRAAEDFDWFVRANDLVIAAGTIDEVLLEKRIHRTNLSRDVALNHANMFLALRQSIARKCARADREGA